MKSCIDYGDYSVINYIKETTYIYNKNLCVEYFNCISFSRKRMRGLSTGRYIQTGVRRSTSDKKAPRVS